MDFQSDQVQGSEQATGMLPFIYGHVDPTRFPVERIKAAAEEALDRYGTQALNYGGARGCVPLLNYLQNKLSRDSGLEIDQANLMLTSGASSGLDIICRLYTGQGDTVLVEAPSYHEALAVIRDYPVRLAAVPLDEEGLIIPALDERLRELAQAGARPRLIYTIPTFQNPSGVTLSTARRVALLELAYEHDFVIVEDDVYRDLAFDQAPPPSLYALDVQEASGQRVINMGSFSKILAPGLRLGWLLSSPEHMTRLVENGLNTSGGGANPFVAFTTAIFCQRGWLEPHIQHLVQIYQKRRDVMLAALQQEMPAQVHWTEPGGGFFVWLTLPGTLTADTVLKHAHQQDITFLTGESFFAEGGGQHNIRLPYSFIPPDGMEQGIYKLAHIIGELL